MYYKVNVADTHLIVIRSGNADQQRSTSNRCNNLACGVCAKNNPHVVHVLFHRPTQRCLCISRELIRFIDDDHYTADLRQCRFPKQR